MKSHPPPGNERSPLQRRSSSRPGEAEAEDITGEEYVRGDAAKSEATTCRRSVAGPSWLEPRLGLRGPRLLAVALASVTAVGCGENGAPTPDRTAVLVYFSLDERRVPVSRVVPGRASELESALRELLKGPTAVERKRGLTSFFSTVTPGALRSVEMDSAGHVVVDIRDLRAVIPGASSSAGSDDLLGQLNRTVFQFAAVRSVEYRMDGSCELFWGWLQHPCRVVRRESVTSVRPADRARAGGCADVGRPTNPAAATFARYLRSSRGDPVATERAPPTGAGPHPPAGAGPWDR